MSNVKNRHLDVSGDDFASPVVFKKINRLNNTQNHKKSSCRSKTRATRKIKNQPTLQEVLSEQFKQAECDVNPEHLQMALALSESMTSQTEEETTKNVMKNEKIPTLSQFGFKSNRDKVKVTSKAVRRDVPVRNNKKSKYRYITPVLFIRTEEDRNSLIQSKISLIMNQNITENDSCKNYERNTYIHSEKLSEIRYNIDESGIFNLNNKLNENNEIFNVKNLNIFASQKKCGCLLNDWRKIPLRDHSPSPPQKTKSKSFEIPCSPDLFQNYESPTNLKITNLNEIFSKIPSENECIDEFQGVAMNDEENLENDWNENHDSKLVNESESDKMQLSKLSEDLCDNTFTNSRENIAKFDFDSTENYLRIPNDKDSSNDGNVKDPCENTSIDLRENIAKFSFDSTENYLKIPNDMDTSNNGNVDSFSPKVMSPESISSSRNLQTVTNFQSSEIIVINDDEDFTDSTKRNENSNTDITFNETELNFNQLSNNFNGENLENNSYKIMSDSDEELPRFSIETSQKLNKTDENTIIISSEDEENYEKSLTPKKSNSFEKSKLYESIFENSSERHSNSNENFSKSPINSSEFNTTFSHLEFEKNPSTLMGLDKLENEENSNEFFRNNHLSSTLNITAHIEEILAGSYSKINSLTLSTNEETPTNHKITFAENNEELFENVLEIDKDDSGILTISDEELNYSCSIPKDTEKPKIFKKFSSFDETKRNNPIKLNRNNKSETCITPKRKVIIKTDNITPMLNYDRLSSPEIVKELDKFGLKPLKRKRGIALLKHLYEATHPNVVCRNEDHEKVPKKMKLSKENFMVFTVTESEDELIFERQRSTKFPTCRIPLQIVWHNFLQENTEIRENILLYEPLQVEIVHKMLKDLGFKFHIQDLVTFFDQKCITIRVAQNSNPRSRF